MVDYCDQLNYMRQRYTLQFEKESFSKNAQGIVFTMHEALLLMNFLPTKAQVKSKNPNNYDLYFAIILNSTDERGKN